MKRRTLRATTATTLAGTATLAVGLGLGAATGLLTQAGGREPIAVTLLTDAAYTGGVHLGGLISPADFAVATGVRTVHATEGPSPRAGLSACTGEQRMAALLPRGATVLAGHFWGRTRGMRVEVEQVAGDHAAVSTYRRILRELRGCQREPATHWHYGALHHADHGATRTIWMPTVNGDGTRNGGVVAAWSQHQVTVAEVDGGSSAEVARVASRVAKRLG